MKTKKKALFVSLLFLWITAGMTGCNKNDDQLWEISPYGKQTVIERKINGIAFKFCLLNEQGKPATVFKEGENFSFYFRIKNETGKNLYYNAYPCAYSDNFFSVSDSSGKIVGKSYEALPQTDIGIAAYPFNNNDSYTFKVAWLHSEKSIVQGGDFDYKSLKREHLKTGNYYTGFSHKFKLFPASGDKHIEIEDIHFKINFKIR
ncbi:hypothetical protein [Tannerella forsythia]|uniref:Lipoprotein n=1 Tax=Tannerella forsythia TaxID=28112 RepID=A0A3P1YX92_TANFO|nr:hypothetical protein [Tannerella forsythia]RRD75624.1 hypothetical protein EII41_06350 [Tannerella forsythia]